MIWLLKLLFKDEIEIRKKLLENNKQYVTTDYDPNQLELETRNKIREHLKKRKCGEE